MILNNVISHLINCARKAVNDFRLRLNNRVDGVEYEVGYVKIEGAQ